ncbi:hypothetical protein COUCH_26365 [Couchioplanes caeruleus]|uniref:hypothetical protein n=1 Tax=Couchioplanes caeruleus TaxID=56438 RepID=UPI0020BFB9DC|nr:hypothetical protein [Couchioplanes caeruleus]UQU62541.1 hypothetical protein COUCH_26365 [Couchioplanes caeruleus]
MSDVLPTPGMGGYALEEFLGDLLKRMERVPGANPRLVSSARNGTTGQGQDGVDHRGVFSDGTRANWQCKDQKTLTQVHIDKMVKDVADAGDTADKNVIVYSRIASARARSLITKQPGWEIWDQADLGDRVRSLLVQDQRMLLDTHFGRQFRQQFLPIASTDAFLLLDDYFAPLLDPSARFHHRAGLAGRAEEVTAIVTALTDPAGPKILLVDGPAGRGKTRLIFEALQQVQENLKPIPVLVRADGHVLDFGALAELPIGPTILLVEDAHRDPAGLAVLLQYARRTDGVRIVITMRSFATELGEQAIVAAQFDLADLMVHSLAPLTAAAARDLVQALQADDVTLTAEFAEQLAQTARATPAIAVIAIAMIRRRELFTAPTLDKTLRREVMARYGQVILAGVTTGTAEQTRKLVATIAALTWVPRNDLPVLDALAQFLGMDRGDLLHMIQALTEHGVLLDRDGTITVVPDLLADEVLAREAVVGGVDGGFAEQLWQAFPGHRLALVASLAGLDWRLRNTAKLEGTTTPPDAFNPIWIDFRAWLLAADNHQRYAALEALPTTAAAQSSRVLALLHDVIATPGPPSPGGWLDHDDVRHRCARLAGICATADHNLLATVFDLLWDLARADSRPPHQQPHHPVRVLENLVRLNKPGALDTAGALLDRLTVWLGQSDPVGTIRTPLFVVEPLLSKTGFEQQWQLNAIGFQAFTVDPGHVRPLRDRIRGLLGPIIAGADVRRAVAAVRLLGEALSEPVGYFGRQVPTETVIAWEDDDLETVAALTAAADATAEPLVRSEIRTAVSWHATLAASPAVKDACKTLIAVLDAHEEDLLTDLLVSGDHDRVVLTPDPADAETGESTGGADSGQAALSRYQEFTREREQARRHVAELLWKDLAEPDSIVHTIAERLRAIAEVRTEPAPGLEPFVRTVIAARPDQTSALFQAIVAAPESPLDLAVAEVLDALLQTDQAGFLAALETAVAGRASLAIGALHGFTRPEWATAAANAAAIITAATTHPDPIVSQKALASAGALLRTDPIGNAPMLVAAASTHPDAVASATTIATMRDPVGWVTTMTDGERRAILSVLAVQPKLFPMNRLLLVALANVLPAEVIDRLAARAEAGGGLAIQPGWGFDRAFADHPDALIDWIRRACGSTDLQRFQWARIWPVIAGTPPTTGGSTAISTVAAQGTTDELTFMAESLAHCDNFVLDSPSLVAEIIEALARHPTEVHDGVRAALLTSGIPFGSSRTPGTPAQQNVDNLGRAQALSQDAKLPESVRQLYRELQAVLQQQIECDLEADRREAEA